jgi:predicted metalloprotease with PDZ domain
VLAARSGLWSSDLARDALAHYAASHDLGRPGRAWRNLQDTANQPILSYRGAQSFPSWQRSKDYYTEGTLLWLDIDTRLRELTRGRRSLDDFARVFCNARGGAGVPSTYTFDDVVATLYSVAHFDWRTFLRERLDSHAPRLPLDGLGRGGWRVAFVEEPSRFTKSSGAASGVDDFLFSLGLAASKEGKVSEVYWDSPAFKVGIAPGMLLVAVDGRAYTAPLLRDSIKAAQADKSRPITLLVRNADIYSSVTLHYHEGLRYPKLERVKGTEDRISVLLRPLVKASH